LSIRKKENFRQLLFIGFFYYFGSSFLGSGTGYLLHATSWNIFILILAAAISISFLLTIKNKSQKID
jgi:YNFM family putative membrane transporter